MIRLLRMQQCKGYSKVADIINLAIKWRYSSHTLADFPFHVY
jgi:hypothetical protein